MVNDAVRANSVFLIAMQENTTEAISTLNSNGFYGNPALGIVVATFGGILLMSFGIMLGAPVLLAMLLLMGGIAAVFGYISGTTITRLYPNGIQQEIRLFIPYKLRGKVKERFIGWNDIRSYRIDTDTSRSMQEYNYLKLYLRKRPGRIVLTDRKDKGGFQAFITAFEKLVRGEEVSVVGKQVSASGKMIKKRKSFYSTVWAKLIMLVFVSLSIALIYFGVKNGMNERNWFRLLAIVVPGTVYICYRVLFTTSKEGQQDN